MQEKANKSSVLKQHYFTPAEGEIPFNIPNNVSNHAAPITLAHYRRQDVGEEKSDKLKTELDGFYILEATGMGFPEDVQQLLLSDKKLRTVVEDDLTYFTELLFVDASENFLELSSFGAIPKLIELRIACNHITEINDLFGFNQLMYLDLSYNKLRMDNIQALEVLPNLKELDLCGNNLGDLPDEWQNFEKLEKLLLNYNKLENNQIFMQLAAAPNLRHLGVANNFLSIFSENATANDGLR